MKYPYSTQVFQFMSMNGGHTFSYSAWRRDINCISRWESFGNIIKHFSSSFQLSYTIRRYRICSHYFNDFRVKIKNRIHSLFVFVCCITSYVKRLQQNIACPNQNIDKYLEKLQFWPCDAGTLRSQKICNFGILFEVKIDQP